MGVGCRVWRGVEPPRVEDYQIPFAVDIENCVRNLKMIATLKANLL